MAKTKADRIMEMAANVALSEIGAGPEITGFSDRDEARASLAALVDEAANAPADPALLALATLGAWLVETQREDAGDVDGGEIHDAFERLGVVTVTDVPAGLCFDGAVRDDGCRCCEYFGSDEVARCHHWRPGIADAIAALLAPDGTASEGVTDGD